MNVREHGLRSFLKDIIGRRMVFSKDFQDEIPAMKEAILNDVIDEIVKTVELNYGDPDKAI